jgi:pSer/pThr/pTyr-binding forkhead associated (FHA) protein
MLWIKHEANVGGDLWEEKSRFKLSGILPAEEGTSGHFTVGRDSACDLQIENAGISREHARLVVTRNLHGDVDCLLEDQRSRNGTTVNGEELKGITQLVAGDVIGFFNKHRLVLFDAPALIPEKPPTRMPGETVVDTFKI